MRFAFAIRSSALVVAVLTASACQDTRSLTVSSSPQGAVLVERTTGATFLAPVTLHYNRDPKIIDAKTGCWYVHGFEARWASGARTATPDRLTLCGSSVDFTYKVDRPADAPDLQADLLRERQVQQVTAPSAGNFDSGKFLGDVMTGILQGYVNNQQPYSAPPLIMQDTTSRRAPVTETRRMVCNPSVVPSATGQQQLDCR